MSVAKFKRVVVWPKFSKFIRLRDCLRTTSKNYLGICISCDLPFPFESLQAGHFLPGRHNANLFYERGVHAQCRKCNLFLHGAQYRYSQALIRLYGKGIIEEIQENDKIIKKFTMFELEMLLNHYGTEIRRLGL